MRKRFRKITAILLTALLITSVVCSESFAVSAAEANDDISVAALSENDDEAVGASSGTTGECIWTLDDEGTLTISGNGKMGDHVYTLPWGRSIKSVIIEKGVTNIGRWVFYDCRGLKSITIPDSVTSIGEYAFENCTGLTSITIPDSVTSIGGDAFACCHSLISITIPNSVTSIGEWAFCDCIGLTSITIPDSVTNISKCLFYYCSSLTRITIPDGVTSIGEEAFCYCTSLKSITIPDSVTSIGELVFCECTSLSSVTIGNSVMSIGKGLFSKCTSLASVTIGNRVTSIGYNAFYNCTSLASLTISDSVTSIGEWAFENCTSLTSITIPDSVTFIEYCAFSDYHLSDVYYGGDETQWSKIQIRSGNDSLTSANIHFNSHNPNINVITETDTDKYIIEQVRKYTSENLTENSQYNAIMNANISGEIKLYLLNELFKNDGFTDVKAGINYLRDTSTYRNDFNFLTTDEIFCANNFYDWLYSDKGFWARASLYTDGLIFNSEFTDYLDPTTYIDEDYPGVKKNKKFLKDFLEQDSKELVFLKESKEVGSFIEMLIKQNGIEYTNAVKELKQKVEKAKTLSEREHCQNQLAAIISEKVQSVNSNKLYFNGKKFTEALGTAVDTIEFVNATTNDIIQIINLDKEIEKYKYYSDFLSGVANSSYVSDDMRMAASSLLDEIKSGYFNHIVSILDSTLEYVDGMISVDKSKWEYFFGDNGAVFGDALATIKIATFIDNIVVDTGDFVNKVSYTLGYAELSKLYSMKLKQDKSNFIAAQTKENAWQFFSDYSMLWSLRYKGEEQYLKMSKLKMFIFGEFETSDYARKSDVVNDNLNFLNQKKFEFAANYSIPEGVMYSSKAVINCPVDVYVYNQSGELIVELKDGVESDVTNEYGRFAVMKQSYSGEYAKIVALNNPDEVVIKSVAHSQGLVDYSFASANDGEVKTCSISNVSVDNGAIISTSNNAQTYSIDSDGDGTNEIEGELRESNAEYVAVSAIDSDILEVLLTTGEQQLLSISVAPDNATNQMVDWFTDKEDVVSIKNGVVKALKPGNATVYVKALDSDDVIRSFEITVNAEIGDTNLDGVITINDVTAIQKHLVGLISFSDEQLALADTNGDGEVNISDATHLQFYLAEFDRIVLGKAIS